MPTVTIERESDGFFVEATCCVEFYGPFAECDGVEWEEYEHTPGPLTHEMVQDIEREAIDRAYVIHENSHCREYELDDDYDDYHDERGPGPDYWIDPESGEYRCG